MKQRRIRCLIAKPGLDGHEMGARLISRVLMDAGMEVIYTGPRQTAEIIVNTALQENAEVIGLSFLTGTANSIVQPPLSSRTVTCVPVRNSLSGGSGRFQRASHRAVRMLPTIWK